MSYKASFIIIIIIIIIVGPTAMGGPRSPHKASLNKSIINQKHEATGILCVDATHTCTVGLG